ncbi:MAG: hypothetical protein PHS14_18085 [Elusimicrobia bacterium]|nr:hypothetical protein [Elusimicrobiota bacterium]
MTKGKLFEYAVIYHPKAKKVKGEEETGGKSILIVDVTRVLANEASEVAMRAARAIPAKYADMLDLVEVVVRPF